jgi:hypothetical protein
MGGSSGGSLKIAAPDYSSCGVEMLGTCNKFEAAPLCARMGQ